LGINKQILNKQLKWPIGIGYQEQIPNHPEVLPDNMRGTEQKGKSEDKSLSGGYTGAE
jgi:hypothetical protein